MHRVVEPTARHKPPLFYAIFAKTLMNLYFVDRYRYIDCLHKYFTQSQYSHTYLKLCQTESYHFRVLGSIFSPTIAAKYHSMNIFLNLFFGDTDILKLVYLRS